uniref:Small integral membrane protein 8 n=1 Tax=Macrostomum lignano TaxID=282301 RepID=A0A1I8GV94_9PLAT
FQAEASSDARLQLETTFLRQTLRHLRNLKEAKSISDLEYLILDPLYNNEPEREKPAKSRKRKAAAAGFVEDHTDSGESDDSAFSVSSIEGRLSLATQSGLVSFLTPTEAGQLRSICGIESQTALFELFNSGTDCGPGAALADACRLGRVALVEPSVSQRRAVRLLGGCYAVPARSSFAISQLCSAKPLLLQLSSSDGPYDVVLADPPWPNASARRRGVYSAAESIGLELLSRIPVPELLRHRAEQSGGGAKGWPGPLVLVWCTNSLKHVRCVLEDLTAAWGLRCIGRWLWVKKLPIPLTLEQVTATGRPLTPLHSRFRRPFERLYVLAPAQLAASSDVYKRVPAELTLMSVPSCLHSRKPCLKPLLNALFGSDDYRCLELFARNLTPGWSSWGNESSQDPPRAQSGQLHQPGGGGGGSSGGGLSGLKTSPMFRALNYELYTKPNKTVMLIGTAALTCCAAFLAYMNVRQENLDSAAGQQGAPARPRS